MDENMVCAECKKKEDSQAVVEKERDLLLSQITEERDLFRSIIYSMDDEVWISDIEGNIKLVNPAFQRAYGIQAEGKSIPEVLELLEILELDGTARQPENAPLLQALKGETLRGEEVFRHLHTGELKYRMYNCSPIKDNLGNIVGSVSVSKDITEKKLAEQELREKNEVKAKNDAMARERQRFYDVLDKLPAMVYLLTSDYKIVYTNHAFEEMFGKALGRPCYELFSHSNFEHPCEFCEASKVFETEQTHHWEVTTLDGSILYIYYIPFTDVDGSPLILAMAIDITDLKRMEDSLR